MKTIWELDGEEGGRFWHKEETACSKNGSWIDEREKTEPEQQQSRLRSQALGMTGCLQRREQRMRER